MFGLNTVIRNDIYCNLKFFCVINSVMIIKGKFLDSRSDDRGLTN